MQCRRWNPAAECRHGYPKVLRDAFDLAHDKGHYHALVRTHVPMQLATIEEEDGSVDALVDGTPASRLPTLFTPHETAAKRFMGFFTAHIRNAHTRRAYYRTACAFADWCAGRGIVELAQVEPMHVAAYLEGLTLAKPSVKQHLAALRMLFDWLVIGQVIAVNPAHAVRGPAHVVKKGRTPVLEREEARALIESIDATTRIGLRDRALIATMIYTFARIGAVLQMNVGDYFSQGRRGWIRLHEKGGKEHESPCVAKLEVYLDEYIAAWNIGDEKDGPFWRTSGQFTGEAHRMGQSDAWRMIRRRAKKVGIETLIGNHSLRATGITAYLKNDGTLEHAQQMANHSSPRTTKLYDRRGDEITLDEYEKIRI
jgi:integrase/recombinase XerD